MTRREHLLICLAEECAEVQKEITKILRFGLKDKPFVAGGNNLEPNDVRLENELNDVMAVVDMLRSEGIKVMFSSEKAQAKKDKVEKYMKYSHSKGLLEMK
jgi:hypothetical protein